MFFLLPRKYFFDFISVTGNIGWEKKMILIFTFRSVSPVSGIAAIGRIY